MKLNSWNRGAPPHVGWWNTGVIVFGWRDPDEPDGSYWGWWDGVAWSSFAQPHCTGRQAAACARKIGADAGSTGHVRWSHYWPENARVPRIDPRQETGHA